MPNLGVVPYADDRSFVIADVPGLIEGAADGAGLGHQFLKHIERTAVLVHLLDCVGDPAPAEAFRVLDDELLRYDPDLLEKPRIVCLNKVDLADVEWIGLCLEELDGQGAKQLLGEIVRVIEGRPADDF